jgi:hypothetical protein
MWALLLTGVAQAGVPVVHDGGAAGVAMAAVAARTGVPVTELEPRSLDSLLVLQPTAVGAAVLRHCAQATTRAVDLRNYGVRAEAAWRQGTPEDAMDQLDLGIAGLGCLSERVEATVAGRMFLLRGGLLARDGQTDAARNELVTGLALLPDAVWDEWLPSDGRVILDELRLQAPTASLWVAPGDAAAGPGVDGRTVVGTGPLLLQPGLHLVQVPSTAGLRSAWLTVDGDAALVVPSSYRRPVLQDLADPSLRPDVERLLQAGLGAQPAYVVAGGGIWLVAVEDGKPVTTTLVEVPAPAPVEEKGRRKNRRG